MAAERCVIASAQFLDWIAALPFSARVVADMVSVCVLLTCKSDEKYWDNSKRGGREVGVGER